MIGRKTKVQESDIGELGRDQIMYVHYTKCGRKTLEDSIRRVTHFISYFHAYSCA